MNKRSIWNYISLGCILLSFGMLLLIVGHIVIKGIANIDLNFILDSTRTAGKEGGIFNVITATLYLTGLSLLFATPVSIAAAIYLQEYAKPGRLLHILTLGIEVLAGVPSIIFGLFGFSLLVTKLGWSWSLLSGSVTLALMALPIVTRVSMEALRAVPKSYRDASLALGADKWTTIIKVVLPAASTGIISGVILSMGRIIGETAAVIFTFGSTLNTVTSIWDSGRTMPVHLYILSNEGISLQNAFATGTLLLLIIIAFNGIAYLYQWAIKRRRS